MSDFHFLRPWFLLAFVMLAVMVWMLLQEKKTKGVWAKICDPILLPYILIQGKSASRNLALNLFAITISLIILASAGPAWKKLPQALYLKKSPLVIVLDMSRSMLATDIGPNRLARAKLKIKDILDTRKDGQTSLLVYTAQPFVVTPLTLDSKNIKLYINQLKPMIMPVQGSRPDLALAKAAELFKNAGLKKGHILIVTDNLEGNKVLFQAKSLASQGYISSVLIVGTKDGGPIPLRYGGFAKQNGKIVISRAEEDEIKQFTSYSGGRYHSISADDSDIKYLLGKEYAETSYQKIESLKLESTRWIEQGPWLLVIILPFAALAFRRGWLAVFVLLIIPLPEAAYASDKASVKTSSNENAWDKLWLNKDQRGLKAFNQGVHDKAIKEFKSEQWKATSFFRSGDFKKALELYQKDSSANGLYNQGNALIKLGKLKDAIAAYAKAFKINPKHKDAVENHRLASEYLKKLKEKMKNQAAKQGQPGQQSQTGQPSQKSQAGQPGQQSQTGQPRKQNNQLHQGQQGQQRKSEQSTGVNAEKNSDKKRLKDFEKKLNKLAKSKNEDNKKKSKSVLLGKRKHPKAVSEIESQLNQVEQYQLLQVRKNPGSILKKKFRYQYNKQQKTNDYRIDQIDPW